MFGVQFFPIRSLSVWPRLLALIAVCVGVVAPVMPVHAQASAPTLSATFALAATSGIDGIRLHLETQFFADGQPLSEEELHQLSAVNGLALDLLDGYTGLVALPPNGDVQMTGVAGAPIYVARDQGATANSAEVLGPAAEIWGAPFWLREQRVVRVRFYPARLDQSNSYVALMPDMYVTLLPAGDRTLTQPPRPDPYWEGIYQQVLVNYGEGQGWRFDTPETTSTLLGPVPGHSQAWRARLRVEQSGLYVLTYEDLVRAGLDPGAVDFTRLQLYLQNQPTAIEAQGEADGHFDPGDLIRFYVPDWSLPYSRTNTLWLIEDDEPGLRVQQRLPVSAQTVLPGYEDAAHREEQQIYISTASDLPNGQRWFWTRLQPNRTGIARETVTFQLAPAVQGPVNAKLRLRIQGQELGALEVRLTMNGYAAGVFTIRNSESLTFETDFPHFLLRDGVNEVVIDAVRKEGSGNSAIVDWLEVNYVRRFLAQNGALRFHTDWPGAWRVPLDGFDAAPVVWDITQPLDPVAVPEDTIRAVDNNGASPQFEITSQGDARMDYVAFEPDDFLHPQSIEAATPDTLRNPDQQADYLIITTPELRPAADRLAAHRAGQGLTSRVIELQEIYDAFNAGVPHPEAIRVFLGYALKNWQAPAPAFVALLGDGHYDPLQYLAENPVQVPVYLHDVDPWLSEVADETLLASATGDDVVPDLLLGRLPVQTLADAQRLVDKLIAYDAIAPDESWLDTMLVVADGPDLAGNFHELADAAAALAEPSLSISKYYLTGNYGTAAALRAAFLADWRAGAFIVNYVGHGFPSAWAGELILSLSDVGAIQNVGRPAILLAMASLTGVFYGITASPSLQEAMLLLPENRGVIGYVASTGFGLAYGNNLVNEGFLQAALHDRVGTLGEAMMRGRLHLYTESRGHNEFLASLFTLIGDPATRLPLAPWPQLTYMPIIVR